MTGQPSVGTTAAEISPGTAHELRVATADDVPRLADALADAFMDDPVYTWLMPSGPRLRRRMRTMFLAELEQYALPNGATVWTTTAGCDGAVVALPPGAWAMPKTFSGREALQWVSAFGRRILLASRVQRSMESHHPREPHIYIRAIGVRSARQGQGLGSALMQPALERADAAGLPAYLEASSERSAALYARFGFVHLGALALPAGGPSLWPMRRPPAPTSARAAERERTPHRG